MLGKIPSRVHFLAAKGRGEARRWKGTLIRCNDARSIFASEPARCIKAQAARGLRADIAEYCQRNGKYRRGGLLYPAEIFRFKKECSFLSSLCRSSWRRVFLSANTTARIRARCYIVVLTAVLDTARRCTSRRGRKRKACFYINANHARGRPND